MVLVTGVNGFIASHIADQILLAGYKVRGTARTAAKAEHLKEYWDKKYGLGKVEIVEVPELGIKGAFDEVVKGMHIPYSLRAFLTNPQVSLEFAM